MSSPESNTSPSPPSLEELSTRSATSLLLPWILNAAAAANTTTRDLAVFVHQPTRSITLIDGSLDVEAILRELPTKDGPLPASKASIESLPVVKVTEVESECVICLTEYEVNTEVKEMPCRHRFHSDCIEKWLGIHGSCPVCRFSMPVEEEEKKGSDERLMRIHVFLARPTDSGRVEEADLEVTREEDVDSGNDELPDQNMEIDDRD